jgi:hypothetical protein
MVKMYPLPFVRSLAWPESFLEGQFPTVFIHPVGGIIRALQVSMLETQLIVRLDIVRNICWKIPCQISK